MSEEERIEMEQHPYLRQALQLRSWDDEGKIEDLELPPIHDFHSEVLAALLAR